MPRGLVVVCLILGAGPAFAQTRLEWKFAAGDSFVLERIYTQRQEMELGAKKFVQETASTWLTSVAIKEKGPKGALLVLTIESVQIKSIGSGSTGGIDNKLAEKMKGLSLTLTLTPHGKITRLDGYDAFIKALAEGKVEVEKALRSLLTEESLRDGFDEVFGFLPERAVSKGDKWKRAATEAAPPFGSFKSSFEYTYGGETDQLHEVSYLIKTAYQPAAASDLFRLVKGGLKSEEGGGEFIFDAARGRLVRGEKSLKLQGDLVIESLGKQSAVTFRSIHTMRIRVLEGKE